MSEADLMARTLDAMDEILAPQPITRKVEHISDATLRELAEARRDGYREDLAALVRQVLLWHGMGVLSVDPRANKVFQAAVRELS